MGATHRHQGMQSNRAAAAWRVLFGLAVLACLGGPGVARAEEAPAAAPRVALRAFGSTVVGTTGKTSASELTATDSLVLNLDDQRSWLGVDAELRPVWWLGFDLGASQGGFREIRFDNRRVGSGFGPTTVDHRTSPLRHVTLSVLYHPIRPGRRVDLYLGPTAGFAFASRAFGASETEVASGGKIGFDVLLGSSRWTLGGVGSYLESRIKIFDDSPKHDYRHTLFAVGLGYRW